MDFVYSAQVSGFLKRIPSSKLAPWVQKALYLALAWQLARLTWLVWPAPVLPNLMPSNQQVAVQAAAANQLDLGPITRLNLFGDMATKAATVEQPVQIDAPETSLNIKLRGILHSSNNKQASVVIEGENGIQSAYFLGDSLTSPAGVVVKEILTDKVILERSGRLETLKLDSDRLNASLSSDSTTMAEPATGAPRPNFGAGASQPAQVDPSNVVDRRNDPEATSLLQEYRNKLISSPISLVELVRANPVMENGVITGYRIRPNKDANAFRSFGLRRNDIVTAVNGTPLGDTSAALGLLSSLSTAQNLTLQVKRGEQKLDILLKMAP